MSMIVIQQDSMVKTSLVQNAQARHDDISRSQETGALAAQRETNRQEDQVVIHTKESDSHGLRTDDEKEKERRRKKREEEEEERDRREAEEAEGGDDGPRARMRRINIII